MIVSQIIFDPRFSSCARSYIPFAVGTAQYTFFTTALAGVNRAATPWLIVSFHAPPYHSYVTHYKEARLLREGEDSK